MPKYKHRADHFFRFGYDGFDYLTRQIIILLLTRMANKAEKWKDNAAGKFYVDQQCIDCDLCRETAPAFTIRGSKKGRSLAAKILATA